MAAISSQYQCVNETFKGYYCMAFHRKQHCTNRIYAPTYSETVSLLNIWYKRNTNNFSICQSGVEILSIISIRFNKGISVTIHSGWATRPVGGPCALMISGLVRIVGAVCVACNNLLFIHSFNNLNLVSTYHFNVTSWCILSETTSVAVNGNLYKFWLYGLWVYFSCFMTPSVVDIQTTTIINLLYMMTSSNGNIFRVTGHLCREFTGPRWIPTQRPVTQSFDVFFDLRPNKRLSKQWWGWWFKTPSCPLWRHCNDAFCFLGSFNGSAYNGLRMGNQSIEAMVIMFHWYGYVTYENASNPLKIWDDFSLDLLNYICFFY